jgi:hypothetical protein
MALASEVRWCLSYRSSAAFATKLVAILGADVLVDAVLDEQEARAENHI